MYMCVYILEHNESTLNYHVYYWATKDKAFPNIVTHL